MRQGIRPPNQFSLDVLAIVETGGEISLDDLAERMGVERSICGQAADRHCGQGLLQKRIREGKAHYLPRISRAMRLMMTHRWDGSLQLEVA